MHYPIRTKQQKAESESYAILLYKLRHLGIFRNQTENDYGIDFELELVFGNNLVGKIVKAQVKSVAGVKKRIKDNCPTVSGIKQSTLAYWCQISYHTPVVAYLVDTKTEKIYISKNLFWQATQLIDGSQKSKTISFISYEEEQDKKVSCLTLIYAFSPSVAEIVHAHSFALKYLGGFFDLYSDIFHYDCHMEVSDPLMFKEFLEVCKVLLWQPSESNLFHNEEKNKKCFKYEFWLNESESMGFDGISNIIAQEPMKKLFPEFLKKIKSQRDLVLGAKYYWSHTNPAFLKILYETGLPEKTDEKSIKNWANNYEKHAFQHPNSDYFVDTARKPAK